MVSFFEEEVNKLKHHLLNNKKISVSQEAPYDPLQAFVRENHIALKGKDQGGLSDLVFAAKDVFKVVGSTYSNGHPEWLRTHEPDDFTSSSIETLLEAGADLVGKTVCDELCFSISGENWHYGSPINPHDPRRLAGGSSSGAGVAVGGGLVDFAIGSDCLGSVRVPASYNGAIGLRPTYQRVANDGEAPYCKSMDVLGYMAQEADIFQQVSKVLLGEDPKAFKFKRLLIAEDCFGAVDEEVSLALEPAVNYLKEHFEEVEHIKIAPEGLAEWTRVFRLVQGYEVWESYGGWIRKHRPFLPPGQKYRLETVSRITRQEYQVACEEKEAISAYIRSVVKEDTLLVLPTAASVAPLRTSSLEEINHTRAQSAELLCISPLSGLPQITLPLIKQDEVPLGISLIGPHDSDLSLTNFATDLQKNFIEKS